MISDANATLLAKLGFAARGVVYILIGWFAVDAALHGGEIAETDRSDRSCSRSSPPACSAMRSGG
jgi:hypothetical protein